MREPCRTPTRRAFTLIEMLVVMALILAIFALGIGYVVFGQDSQHSVTAAQSVTGALLNAKQRARRDLRPTGVRILFDPNTKLASQLQFIQQPDDYNFGMCTGSLPPNPPNSPPPLTFGTSTSAGASPLDFQGGASFIGEIDESTVQAGDYFTVAGVATPHRINKVYYTNDSQGNPTVPTINLDSAAIITPGQAYAIIRAPRRLPSEDTIQLPSSVAIDAALSQNLPLRTLVDYPPAPIAGDPTKYDGTIARVQQYAEILYASSGGVVGQGTGADKVYLWLRDPTAKPGTGAPLILSTQIRTGLIGVYPVAPGADPYLFVKDPRASGL